MKKSINPIPLPSSRSAVSDHASYALASFIIALVNRYYLSRSFYTLPGLISGIVVSALIIFFSLAFSLLVLIRHNSV